MTKIPCKECATYGGHHPLCSLIDFEDAVNQLKQYYKLWLERDKWAGKKRDMWRKEANLWKGKFYEVKHENNQFRKKLTDDKSSKQA